MENDPRWTEWLKEPMVKTCLRAYGKKYNLSAALTRKEAWLYMHEKGSWVKHVEKDPLAYFLKYPGDFTSSFIYHPPCLIKRRQ